MNNPFAYSVLMIIAGIGIPIMATLNGGLGARLQSPTLAATILFLVGLLMAGTYLLITEGIPDKIFHSSTPIYYYFGGFFVLFYILTITWVAPRFGISNAIAFVLLGQMIAMSLIDHFGLLGAQQFSLAPQRMAGLGLMVAGVFLVLNKAVPGTS
ncbi:DMT family transporter [Marinobacter sp. F3R08]|uniref:DMT family transporter n=1 Tax=Marinobacter sp. F3R08 TaxID=2841559 RepID=UPI001C07FF76|nr:DMT family transporter [Marinobacter sp. F3R08]MBU2955937.1 DMT family transporter [Marinobacter sp. F3R08]